MCMLLICLRVRECLGGLDGGLVWCMFFFKQKTAYEMRISDWSSDVCSSDLAATGAASSPIPTASSSPILVPLIRPPPTFVAGPPGPSSIDHQIIAGAPRAAVRQFNAIALGEHRGTAAIAALRGAPVAHQLAARKRVVWGKRVSVRVALGGSRISKKKN